MRSSRSSRRAARRYGRSTSRCSAAALDRLAGIDPKPWRTARSTTRSRPSDAVAAVEAGSSADAAFLLEPTPVISIEAVAREGDVMPQKSTYFYPKALTGLVINPHEW